MRRIKFEDFELDMELFTLRRAEREVKIGRRSLDLLVCLVENRDRVLDLKFLRDEVWNSAALSAAAIPTCILELRRALGDNPTNPRFIKSVRGRGYRFIGKITYSPNRAGTVSTIATELPFSGRRQEMFTMRSCISTTIAEARGHIILVGGEAGIGKSRLVSEFLGSVAAKIECFEVKISAVEGTPPFWPWTQILREALSRFGPNNRELVEHAQALSTVFPEIRGAVNPASTATTKVDRFSVLAQWARTIRTLIGPRPLVLAFEDIHRADADSLTLLLRLAEELANDPVVIVATHRPPSASDEAAQIISDIGDTRHATSIDLAPLSSDDIWSMLDPLTKNRDRVSEELELRSSGNAFYVTHLIRYLDVQSNQESPELLVSEFPLKGGEIVSRQLSDLPKPTRNALAAAAILGERFSVHTLSNVLDVSPNDLIVQLEPAERAWLIREAGTEYHFTHALLRDALYQTIEPSRRKSIHLLLARDLSCRSDAHLKSTQISDHLECAMPLAPYDEACRFAVLAGREAASRFAFSRAKFLFTRAYRIMIDDPDADLRSRCEVMQELARCILYDGDREAARRMLLEAMRLARNIEADDLFAACALDLVPDFLSIEVGLYDSALIRLLDQALASTPKEKLALRAQLLARSSQARQWAAAPDVSESLAIESLELARTCSDPDALAAALSARAESLQGPDRVKTRLRFISELGVIARRTGALPTLLLQKTRKIAALLELGNIRDLELENERYREVAAEIGLPQYRWYPGATDTMLAMMRGDITQADSLATEYKEFAGKNPDHNFLQTYACQHVVREIERNRSHETVALVTGFATQQKAVFSWSAALAWLHWDAGNEEQALESTKRFSKQDIISMSREAGGGIGVATLGEVTARIGDREKAAFLYEIISPLAARCATAGYGIAYFGSFSRYAGILALSLGNPKAAIDHLRLAVRQEAARGARSWLAYAQIDLLRAYRKQGLDTSSLKAKSEESKLRLSENGLVRAVRVLEESILHS
jgi:DNA-binding winged helix-turn-helix (wHTH) protein